MCYAHGGSFAVPGTLKFPFVIQYALEIKIFFHSMEFNLLLLVLILWSYLLDYKCKFIALLF